MNRKMIFHTIGIILLVEAGLMLLPLIVSIIYSDGKHLAFIIPAITLFVCGFLLMYLVKPKRKEFGSKEGLLTVGLSWIMMSFFGSLPYMISKEIPNFINALFETVSGFTTTGASILFTDEYPLMSKSIMFYRSFTHFVGGMGVLVFVLAILPQSNGKNLYILKAESSGPQVGKLVSKIKVTAMILYLMYIIFTLIEITLLAISPSMNLYEAIVYSFSTAGTGGFTLYSDSCASFSSYCQIVMTVFMALFGVNFNLYYLIIIGKLSKAIKSEELRVYFITLVVSSILISLNVFYQGGMYDRYDVALKDSFFQTVSYMTSTGFANAANNTWPTFSKFYLITLMYFGACAGSTGGGLKVSRIIIAFKSAKCSLKKLVHPKAIERVRLDGAAIGEDVEKGVLSYIMTIFILVFVSTVIIALDGNTIETSFSTVSSCINNIGLAFGRVGEEGTFGFYSPLSKVVLTFLMLIGRLELYPVLILFNYKAWQNK